MSHRYLILGLLVEQPMTGYDIKKRVDAGLSAATNASYGTLYPTLHKLLAEGAVEVQEVPQVSRPSKKVYHVTERGRQALATWLKQPAAADQIRREFLLKLYLSQDLSEHEVQTMLAVRKREIQTLLKTLRAEQKRIQHPRQVWIMDYALSLCQAELEWLDNLETQIVRV
ncbi:MAG: PadR family transcriptional regulator [Anaerolineae bacterium]|jgi:DNA-binding PadR family transcriptional regulator|nr:PadR family transcriptional regulator [Anaerolineae bacterium]